MKKLKFVYILLSLIAVAVFLSSCKQEGSISQKVEIKQDEDENVKIDDSNAKALNISKVEFNNVEENSVQNRMTRTKIENSSVFNLSDIKFVYSEFDKSGNLISADSKTYFSITLSPGDTAFIDLEHKEFANKIEINSYAYTTEGKRVVVNLKDEKVKVIKSNVETENSKTYETLVISDFKKISDAEDGNTYSIKIKNSTSKDLGKLVLNVAELNSEGDYINIEHVAYNSVLKGSEEAELDIVGAKEAEKLEVVGYIYNDTEQNKNIYIDFKSHKALID